MDCFVPQDPYNMERVFWLLSNKDGALVKKMMEEFQLTHAHTLPDNLRKQLCEVLSSGSVSDEGILETMRRCWEENRYLLCPHSAVAVWHHYNCPHSPALNRCYVATASPVKFQGAMNRAGLTIDLPETVRMLDKLKSRYENLERSPDWCKKWEQRLRYKIQSFS
ncbi:threonine synthase-like 2 [Cynoglossus semilaevis]|uniref:threonine synthase-like 2 n=1 Tax=Cynoglossus semilaevis TaxID=244447 RepID=UPI0004951F55|nr:threonine synthase-like 2 [Cynoglossus semilaevis]